MAVPILRHPVQVEGSKVFTGPTPEHPDREIIKSLESFDVIINVSDTPGLSFETKGLELKAGCKTFWFSIPEAFEWDIGTLDAALTTLDWAQSKNLSVYVHCHGGACRAPTVCALWTLTRKNASKEQLLADDNVYAALARRQISWDVIDILSKRPLSHYSTDGLAAEYNPTWALAHRRLKLTPESIASL